jgi:hypothetical protein
VNLAEALPIEQARCREILAHARELPAQSGFFLVLMLDQALRRAEQAAAAGDVVGMLTAYRDLKEFKE